MAQVLAHLQAALPDLPQAGSPSIPQKAVQKNLHPSCPNKIELKKTSSPSATKKTNSTTKQQTKISCYTDNKTVDRIYGF